VITIGVRTDEERQAVARAMEDGSLAAALGVPFKVERVSVGPGGGAGTSWLTIGSGGIGPVMMHGFGPGGGSGGAVGCGGPNVVTGTGAPAAGDGRAALDHRH